jgi:hypothetical protein
MNGKVLGIPLVLIVLAVVIAFLVNVPMFLIHRENQQDLEQIRTESLNTTLQLQNVQQMLITPTATPEAEITVTPAPTRRIQQRVITPTPTQ